MSRRPTSNEIEVWYREHRAAILAYARRRVGDDAAEDVVQQVFLKASLAQYTDQGKPLAWLYTIARNLIFDEAKRLRPVIRDEDISLDRTIRNGRPSPHEQAVTAENTAELHAAMRRLSPPQFEAIRAQLAGIRTVGTLRLRNLVKARRQRAVTTLRRLMRKE